MFDQKKYDANKEEFTKVIKKISNYATRELPKEEQERSERINTYVSELVESYNKYISYTGEYFQYFNEQTKVNLKERISEYKLKVLRSLAILSLEVDLPENFDPIEKDKIIKLGSKEDLENNQTSTVFVAPSTSNEKEKQINETNNVKSLTTENNTDSKQTENEANANLTQSNNTNNNIDFTFADLVNTNDEINEMAQTFIDFMNIATKTINFRYNGDPLSLRTFISKIKLLDRATSQENKEALVEFVLSCLEGKALEVTPLNPATVQEIIDALNNKIKFENVMVIEGRLMAIRADQNKLNDFATKAEAIADDLIRALTLKKVPIDVASEMAVDKTIELCQLNARNDGIRHVLSSVKFETPKEVISKYLIESRKQVEQKQILQCHKQNVGRGNNRGRYENNGNRQSNFASNNYNQNSNNRGNFRGNYRGNFRGNFRGRGRRGNWNNNWNGNYGQNGQDRRNVYYAENMQAPPPGAQNQNNVQLNQAEQ